MNFSSDKQTSGIHFGGAAFSDFVKLVEFLRSPDGCPWDRKQTHHSLTTNMIEEAYEAVDAIETGTSENLREELGDVLLQVVLHAQIAAEEGTFNIEDVIAGVHQKIVSRHPHVFDKQSLNAQDVPTDSAGVSNLWAAQKIIEKGEEHSGLFDSLSYSQPALLLADDISKKAVSLGFEWGDMQGVLDKHTEEISELLETDRGSEEAFEEVGDVFFTAVNLARKYKVNPEAALRASCRKFTSRWAIMEKYASELGQTLGELSLEEQEALWQKAKRDLKEIKGESK